MAITKAYPRRKDAVWYEVFDGSLASAQAIANLTSENIYMYLPPNVYAYAGDTILLTRIEVGSRSVARGDYVIVEKSDGKAGGKFLVVPGDEFADRYSKDGN